jgi:uncharacterized protein (TIGR00369 family)
MSHSEEMLAYFKSHIGRGYPENTKSFGKWLEPIVREVEPKRLVLEYLIRSEQANHAGLAHGGVIASIIDETIGAMMVYIGDPHFKASINLSIDFISTCRPGDVLLAEARLVKYGNTLSFGECIITRKDDTRLIAKGSCNTITLIKRD